MIVPLSADAATTGLPPLLFFAVSVMGGALLTALFALFGAWLTSRREQARWIRQERFAAYTKAFALTKAFDLNYSKQKKIAAGEDLEADEPRIIALMDEADALYATVAETLAPIIILGPDSVTGPAHAMQIAYERDDREALKQAEVAFQRSARKALKIKG